MCDELVVRNKNAAQARTVLLRRVRRNVDVMNFSDRLPPSFADGHHRDN